MGVIAAFGRDLRYAARVLRHSPGFATVALLSLALGIGANTAIFQLLDALRLRSLPVEKPDELVEVRIGGKPSRSGSFNGRFSRLTFPQYEQIRDRQEAFSGLFAWSSRGFNLAPSGEARNAQGVFVSGDFFRTLGVKPFLGRLLTMDDDRAGGAATSAVISYQFWQREFGGKADVLGAKMLLDGQPFDVIGVAPAGFFGLEVGRSFDVAIPLRSEARFGGATSRLDTRHAWWLAAFGRLKPGWSLEKAATHLNQISSGVFETTVPEVYRPDGAKNYVTFKLTALPAGTGVSALRQDFESPLWMLLAITGLVLLITCANLANLMLARASVRERDMAIRLAVGASRGRLIRQLLAESLLLAAIGAALGILVAQILTRVLVTSLATGRTPITIDLNPDWRVFAFIAGLAVLTCLLFGLTPAVRAAGTSLGAVMKSGGRGVSGAKGLGLRRILVVAQVALSLILMVGALLFVRSFQKLLNVDAGFQRDGVLVTSIDLPQRSDSVERLAGLHRELTERLNALPEVETAAEVSIVPISGSGWNENMRVEGGAASPDSRLLSNFNRVGPQYFETMGTPILSGRDFNERDTLNTTKVALVNETFARKFLNGGSPIGKVIRVEAAPGKPEPAYEIVGMVRDSKYRELRENVEPLTFLVSTQEERPDRSMQFVVRSSVSLAALTASVKRAVMEVDPGITIVFQNLRTQVSESLVLERLMAMLSGFFGLLAGLLATIGLYGVISYSVARRKHEIGIRIALGASRRAVIRLVLLEAGLLLAVGLVAGSVLAVLAARTASSMLFGLQPYDPLTISLAVGLLASVGIAASYIPALRAAAVDPMVALRSE
ncbi:MAG: ABC transporter permease [Acidobacteriota bacterium]